MMSWTIGCDDRMNDFAGDVGQAEVAAGVAVGEPGVVQAHQVQDGGVQVVHVDFVDDGGVAEFVIGFLEGINIQQDHGKSKSVAVAALYLFDEDFIDRPPVIDTGQIVVLGNAFDFFRVLLPAAEAVIRHSVS